MCPPLSVRTLVLLRLMARLKAPRLLEATHHNFAAVIMPGTPAQLRYGLCAIRIPRVLRFPPVFALYVSAFQRFSASYDLAPCLLTMKPLIMAPVLP